MTFKRLKSHALFPRKGTKGSTGYDLFSLKDVEIPAKENAIISTGIQIKLPNKTYGRIAPRSGIAIESKIDVMGTS